jgi:Co/Zn/Cd efflux system component
LVAEVQRELQQQEAVDKIENLKVWSTNRGKHYGALRVRVLPGKSITGLREIFSSRGV